MKKRRSKKADKKSVKSVLTSKFFLLLCTVLIMLFSVSVVKELLRRIEINKEISTLEQEIGVLESNNQELANLIDYINSSRYQEKEIKARLNLQESGEQVVFVPQNGRTNSVMLPDAETGINANIDQSGNANYTKWWNYFFQS